MDIQSGAILVSDPQKMTACKDNYSKIKRHIQGNDHVSFRWRSPIDEKGGRLKVPHTAGRQPKRLALSTDH